MTKYHLIIVFKSFDKPLHLYYDSRSSALSAHFQMKQVFGADLLKAELEISYYRDHGDSDITLISKERGVLK